MSEEINGKCSWCGSSHRETKQVELDYREVNPVQLCTYCLKMMKGHWRKWQPRQSKKRVERRQYLRQRKES